MQFKKMVTIGLVTGLTFAASLAHAGNIQAEPAKGVSIAQAQTIVSQSQHIDISHIAPNVDLKFIVMQDNLMKVGNVGGEASLDMMAQTCKIDMPVGESFISAKLGTNEGRGYLNDVIKSDSLSEEKLRTEFAVIHEAAHCNLYSTATPFKNANKEVEDILNKYYKFSGSTYEKDAVYQSIYYTLHENYADTLASMEIIRKYGDTKEVVSMLTKINAERNDVAVSLSKKGFDSHSTGYSLEEVLKPENISKIMLAPSSKDLQNMALDIANQSTTKVIATYGDIGKIVSNESLYSGVASITSRMIYGMVTEKDNAPNVNLHMESNELYKIAKITFNELENTFKSDFVKMKSEKDVEKWLEQNHSEVINEALNQVNYNVGMLAENGNDIVKKVENTIKSENTGIKLTLKEIRDNTKAKLASINGEDNKNTVMANIVNIRDGQELKVSSTPTKKP